MSELEGIGVGSTVVLMEKVATGPTKKSHRSRRLIQTSKRKDVNDTWRWRISEGLQSERQGDSLM
jgi:hypothetical protein